MTSSMARRAAGAHDGAEADEKAGDGHGEEVGRNRLLERRPGNRQKEERRGDQPGDEGEAPTPVVAVHGQRSRREAGYPGDPPEQRHDENGGKADENAAEPKAATATSKVPMAFGIGLPVDAPWPGTIRTPPPIPTKPEKDADHPAEATQFR